MAPRGRAARPRPARRDVLLGGAFTAIAYAVLPALAPRAFSSGSVILLMGVILGLVAGLAFRLGPTAARVMATVAGLTILVRFPLTGAPVPLSLAIGVIVAAEILAITTLLRWRGAGGLQRVPDIFRSLLIALAVALAASLVAMAATVALVSADPNFPEHNLVHLMAAWFVDDLFGLAVIMPAVLLLPSPRKWNLRRAPEFLVAAAAAVLSTVYVFFLVDPASPGLFGWPYFILLVPIWAAIRLGAAATSAITAVSFWIAVVATVDGTGPFTRSIADPFDELLTVEVFVTAMAVAILVLAVLRDERLATLARVEESSRLLREIIDATDAMIFAKDYREPANPGVYVAVNRAWSLLRGRSRHEALGHSDAELYPPEVADGFRQVDRQVLDSNEVVVLEPEDIVVDGDRRQYVVSKFPLRDDSGRPWGVGGIGTDISVVVEARRREQHQADLLAAVFEQSPTPALRLDMGEDVATTGKVEVLAANASMCRLMGAAPGAFSDCDLVEHMHPDDREQAVRVLVASLEGGSTAPRVPLELRLRTLDGRTVWVLMSAGAVARGSDDESAEVVVQFEDFTARREAEQALAAQALRDAVTGLPNRRALSERMGTALERLRRRPGTVTVFFCDLDRFKDVNDSLGHQAGDRMLTVVAGRLRAALRPEDTLARLGGDEFVAMAEGITTDLDRQAIADRMMARLHVPWSHEHAQFTPSMSVGVATTSDPDVTPDELLRRADVAMYRAKESGRSQVVQYDKSIDDRVQQAVAVQHDLRSAIDTGTLIVHHQPLVQLQTGHVTSTEALVRLPGRDGSLVPPGLFISEAEVTGLIVPMGEWVLDQALADVVRWRASGRLVGVSVNVSPAQLSEGFAERVLERLDALGAQPDWLSLEVTESALIHEPIRTGRELTALSRAGVRVALDDFGTGYSSLSWLAQLPVSTVKIDRSFVADLGIDQRKGSIVRAIIEVSHDLGFDVVAEGVETPQQRTWLLEAGCDRGQGYLFGRPVPADEVVLA